MELFFIILLILIIVVTLQHCDLQDYKITINKLRKKVALLERDYKDLYKQFQGVVNNGEKKSK